MGVALVVDDSGVIRKLCRGIMENLGYDVLEAADGQEALDSAREVAPDVLDVIMLDWNMPVMNGMQFLMAFRQLKDYRETKVIFCTTENDFSKIQEAMLAGADEYIMKPFGEDVVRDKLTQLGMLEG